MFFLGQVLSVLSNVRLKYIVDFCWYGWMLWSNVFKTPNLDIFKTQMLNI